jgi:hypothetical protein
MLTYADSALEMRRNTRLRQCHEIFKSMQLCSSAAQILRSFHAASANHDGRHSSARDVKLIRPEAHSEAMKTRGRWNLKVLLASLLCYHSQLQDLTTETCDILWYPVMYRMSQCRPNSKLSAFECFPEHSAKALLGLCQCSTWHLACPSLMRGQSKLDRREAPGTPATGKMQNGPPNFKQFIHS